MAEKGFDKAQTNLGWHYEYGKCVAVDYAEAFKWYNRAAHQGDAIAQYSVGRCYVFGRGIKQDYVQACKWLALSIALGDDDARKLLENIQKHMKPQEIKKAQQLAMRWKPSRIPFDITVQ